MSAVDLAQAAAETNAWRTRSHLYGTSFKQGHRIGWRDALTYAGPTWNTLTPAQRLEHIESCPVCIFCEAGRAWGVCPSCGKDPAEALPPDGLSRCCGSVVNLNGEAA